MSKKSKFHNSSPIFTLFGEHSHYLLTLMVDKTTKIQTNLENQWVTRKLNQPPRVLFGKIIQHKNVISNDISYYYFQCMWWTNSHETTYIKLNIYLLKKNRKNTS